MIIIISSQNDRSTTNVIQWLLYSKTQFSRLNGEIFIKDISILIQNDSMQPRIVLEDIKNSKYYLNSYDYYWYRRNNLKFIFPKISKINQKYIKNLNLEWSIIENYIYTFLENKAHLGSLSKEKYHNKIEALTIAQSVGLSIPKSYIISSKDNTKKFLNKNTRYITKALYNLFTVVKEDSFMSVGTKIVNTENIELLGNVFYPTFFQEYIEKLYEIRVFILENKCYSMAIFSQNDKQTSIDFRNYNRKKPNRMIPYKLPVEIEKRLLLFMKKMNLDTGSIDIIVSHEYEYFFLEVNHLGQYDWLSKLCNYYLDKEISHLLSKKIV